MQCNNIKEIQISFEALKKGVAKFSSLLLQSQPLFDRLSSNVSETSGSQILLIQSERNLSSTIQPSGNFEGRLFQQSGDILLGSPQSSGNSAQALSQPLQNMRPPKPPQYMGPPQPLQNMGLPQPLQSVGLPQLLQSMGLPQPLQSMGLPQPLQNMGPSQTQTVVHGLSQDFVQGQLQ